MSRHHRPVGPRVSAGEGKTFETLKNLWPHLWPHSRPDLKRAVLLAFGALILGKVTTVFLPYIYKWTTDALAAPAGEPQTVQLLAVPVLLVIAYGVVRIASNGFNQLRDALFAAVGQHAVRELATSTFRHLHAL